MTICAPQLGQKAALWGLRNLADWVAAERAEILRRRAAARAALSALPGWRILGCGAYFAYVEHPHPLPSNELAPLLVRELSLLMLPGTMFAPEGDARRPSASSASPSPTSAWRGCGRWGRGWRRWGRWRRELSEYNLLRLTCLKIYKGERLNSIPQRRATDSYTVKVWPILFFT